MLDPKFVILGALLNLVGSTTYVWETLKGRTKPNRVTWFLWALAPLIAFAAELGEGVGIQALMTFMVGFGPLLIFLASFVNRKSYWKITTFDVVCGCMSLIALGLWAITQSGNLAIVFSIFADGLAAVPTVIKSYRDPQTENSTVFLLGAISAVITLLTITSWTFAHYAFPLYILLICLLLFTLIKFPKFRLHKHD